MAKWEIVSDKYRKNKGIRIKLPKRGTELSAGYDLFSPVDFEVPAYGDSPLMFLDIKAQIDDNQVLLLFPRSSQGSRGITLANTIGVIDADYYNNLANDGNIGIQLRNSGSHPMFISAGDRIGQAILMNFSSFENGNVKTERNGGFGSSGV